jgi:hypothetical protein
MHSIELSSDHKDDRRILSIMVSYLVTMILIDSNIRIAEIYHPPCRKKFHWNHDSGRSSISLQHFVQQILITAPGLLVRVSHIAGPRWPSLTAPSYWQHIDKNQTSSTSDELKKSCSNQPGKLKNQCQRQNWEGSLLSL